MTLEALALLISLLVCHFLADYTWLSRPYMLQAKRFGHPVDPIAHHAFVHAVLMFFVLVGFGVSPSDSLIGLLFQFWTHFLIDLLKGRMNVWFPSLQSLANVKHWIVFGVDQTLHMIVIFIMVYGATSK